MKNILLITIIALISVTGIFFSVKYASAQDTDSPVTTLVQKIAQKFGLNESDVQAVFDEHREEIQTQMQKRFEERMTQAVIDGKITEEQKQTILAKHKEMRTNMQESRQNWQNMTDEERQAAKESLRETHKNYRAQLETWVGENGIELSVLREFMGPGMKRAIKVLCGNVLYVLYKGSFCKIAGRAWPVKFGDKSGGFYLVNSTSW